MVGDRGHAAVLNRDLVQRLERMDDADVPVLLEHAEPSRTVGRVRRLVNSGVDLLADERDDLIVDAGRDGEVLLDPRNMRDDRELDRREHVATEVPALGVLPSEALVLLAHHVVEDREFLGRQPLRVILVQLLATLRGVTSGGFERFGVGVQCRHVLERVADVVSDDAEVLWELGRRRVDLERYRFVLLLRLQQHLDLLVLACGSRRTAVRLRFAGSRIRTRSRAHRTSSERFRRVDRPDAPT